MSTHHGRKKQIPAQVVCLPAPKEVAKDPGFKKTNKTIIKQLISVELIIIVDTFKERDINPVYIPGCICHSHGPFAWGNDAYTAVHNAVVMEEVAKMNLFTLSINPDAKRVPKCLQDKHFLRKHGKNAYYGN